ncbi:MAG: hypothetical protein WCL08_00355 [Verrucomicrobiota bacterium]
MKNASDLPDQLDYAAKKKSVKRLAGSDRVIVNGVKWGMTRDPKSKVWYIRKRTKDVSICHNLGVSDVVVARERAREFLSNRENVTTRLRTGGATLREVCNVYLAMPKRAAVDTAAANVERLAKVVSVAWGKTLETVSVGELSVRLWEDYAAKRQGGKLDLSTRRHENRGINSALRMAVSVFHEGLAEGYRRGGITLDLASIGKVQWLPIIPSRLAKLSKESETTLYDALPALKQSNLPMWRAVMIARYAGLRAKEIKFSSKSWLTRNEQTDVLQFEICDRPEELFWHKTGEEYTAPVLSAELEEDLLACPDGLLIPTKGLSREQFFSHTVNAWIRKFISRPNKGLHRLRALYLEHLKNATVLSVRAELAGIEAARAAAGHTSSKTTKRSYLPATGSPLTK